MEPRQQAGHGVQDRDPDAAGGREMQMKEKLQMQCNEIQWIQYVMGWGAMLIC